MCAEYVDLLIFVFCITSILVMYKLFGLYGLYAYNLLITIAANVQIMKIAQYSYICDSMAIGTVAFSTIFIVDSIIVEKYGMKPARVGLYISILSYLVFIVLMYCSMLYASTRESAIASGAIEILFSQSWSIFISSICAYLISQFFEIHFYTIVKKVTFGKCLWVRYNLSIALSMFLDQLVFSVLCWKVFGIAGLSIKYIIIHYIIFNYYIRLVISICATPVVYLARSIKPLKV